MIPDESDLYLLNCHEEAVERRRGLIRNKTLYLHSDFSQVHTNVATCTLVKKQQIRDPTTDRLFRLKIRTTRDLLFIRKRHKISLLRKKTKVREKRGLYTTYIPSSRSLVLLSSLSRDHAPVFTESILYSLFRSLFFFR